MTKEERAAFEEAYRECVAVCPEKLSAFLDDYFSDDHDGDALYEKYPNCYSSMVDSITLWQKAIDYKGMTWV